MNDTSLDDRERWPCPACGDVMYPQGAAPGVYWCDGCQREYWREGNDWWRCDESGDPERVNAVADGGTTDRCRVELDLIDQDGTVAERIILDEGDEFTSELLTDKWTIRCRSLGTGGK